MSCHMRLQTKLLTVIGVLVVTVVLITSGFITVFQKQRLMQDTYRLLERDTGYLSNRIGHNLFNANYRSIEITLSRAMDKNPEMLFFEVRQEDGMVLISSDYQEAGLEKGACNLREEDGEITYEKGVFAICNRPLVGDVVYDGQRRASTGDLFFETCTRLKYAGVELGWLKIGYSSQSLQTHIREVAIQVLAAGLLILMTVIGVVVCIVRISIAPLVRLNERLSALRDGSRQESVPELLGSMDLPAIFEETTTTEIKELALSFASLSDIVVQNWQNQESHRYDLEKNVTDRTAALRRANRALLREITEKKDAEKRLQLKNSLMEALHESTLDLIREVEFQEILKVLLRRASTLMNMDSGFYFEYREGTGKLHSVVSFGPFSEVDYLAARPGEGLVGHVWASGEPLHVADYMTWEGRVKGHPGLSELGTCVAVPIRLSENIGGVMGLAQFGSIPMDETALGVLSRFGELASIALSNAMLHTQIQDELRERLRVEEEKERLFQHLLQAQKLEAIGTLAGGVAHDINNLLMAVQGNITLIQGEASGCDRIEKRCVKVEELVASGSKLTSQLLGFARGGRYHVKPERVNTIVANSLSMFGRTRKGLSLIEELGDGLSNVEIDRTQMEQVLLNLFLNASHAMPDGGRLTITTSETEMEEEMAAAFNLKPGTYVTVSVSDTGVGMDASTQSKIFDPFFTTREMGHGTGLGLASAYGIVKNHKGCITVTSEKGKGARFVIYLPATLKAKFAEEESPLSVEKGEGTVLVVDDEEAIREVFGGMLSTLGYACLFAENSSAALSTFRKHAREIDVVLLDMVMPDAGGDIAYKALRKIDPGVKVILSSGYSREGRAEKIMKTGCNGFIQKPFTLEQLSKEVHRVLQES